MTRTRRATAALMALALALIALDQPASAAPTDRAERCHDLSIPVSLQPGTVKSLSMYAELCRPVQVTKTILLLVHGVTYDHDYWSFPNPDAVGDPDRYDFTVAANRAGFATLAVDRIGSTRSSKPVGVEVTMEASAQSLRDVIEAIRAGEIRNAHGDRFERIVYVGHSMGSAIGWFVADSYLGVDAYVFTGATHKMAQEATAPLLDAMYPAALDPQLASKDWDLTYLTTKPGKRGPLFYAPAAVDRRVIAYDEAHKSAMSPAETLIRFESGKQVSVLVPVLLVVGAREWIFCGGTGGADCSTSAALRSDEGCQLGPNVPSVDAYVQPDAGHMLNQGLESAVYFDHVTDWITGRFSKTFVAAPPDCST